MFRSVKNMPACSRVVELKWDKLCLNFCPPTEITFFIVISSEMMFEMKA
jgi:hypothetical protein